MLRRTTLATCLAVAIVMLAYALVERGYAQVTETFLECRAAPADKNDGITLLTNACTLTPTNLWHDATTHGFCREIISVGCDISAAGDCLGRCGPGCGASGAGVYSLDCAEHDRCCRVHGGCLNPFDSSCGDEYRAAADDFLFGTPNCTGGCRPIDIYFLVDLSGSFFDDLPVFKTQVPSIISTLKASHSNIRFGLGKFEDYPISPFGEAECGDKAYERLVDLTSDTALVLNTIAGLFTRCGSDDPQSQLPALFQAATGAGQNLSGVGFPGASIPPRQQANFRDGAVKLILLWTDAEFHLPGDPGTIPYPGPSFNQVISALTALDPAKVIGISSGGGGLANLQQIATATGSVAPPGGVDCNGDGIIDIPEGSPLVCSISSSGVGIGEAILAIVEAALKSPIADAGGPYTGTTGSPITFDASGSFDPDGTIVLYEFTTVHFFSTKW